MPRGHGSASLALAAVDQLVRPASLGGSVEIAIASPAPRTFPTRVSGTLGVCLKIGPAHRVMADGRWLEYPADAICVRTPGCVWSSDVRGPIGFVSLDMVCEDEPPAGQMTFLGADAVPDLRALVGFVLAPGARLAKQEAVSSLLAALCDHGVIAIRALGDRDPAATALERARSFLDESLAENPSLDEIAAEARMNKHVLVRRFRHRFGTTPHSYLVLSKVERARDLLARGTAPAEVAVTLGFADQAHLTRTFQRRVGLAPGTYQRRVRTIG